MLKTLCEIPAPSGGEEKLKEFIISELKDSIDLYFEDSFGNLIFVKKGSGDKKICIECALDEPFLMVSAANDNKIRYTAPPHIKASYFEDKTVIFPDGETALIKSDKKDEKKDSLLHELYTESKEKVKTGECVCLEPCYKEIADTVFSFNLKYKLPILVLMNVIKKVKKPAEEIFFVFSVQSCLAARGVRALMQSGISFDKAISVGCIDEEKENPCLIVKEKSCVLSKSVRECIEAASLNAGITLDKVLTEENFYMKTYLSEGFGAPCGLLCIPSKKGETAFLKSAEMTEKILALICIKGDEL